MLTLTTSAGALPPTATYASREWSYSPVLPGDATDDRTGTLVIVQRKGKSVTTLAEMDAYGVQETHETMPTGVRAFLLLNDTDRDQPDVYECVVGALRKCSCKAGKCKLGCKHVAALEALISQGGL